jgi:hypothetical protein
MVGELRRLRRILVVPRPRSANLRRLGRTLAASEAVPLTIHHTLVDRAGADLLLKNNNLCEIILTEKIIPYD